MEYKYLFHRRRSCLADETFLLERVLWINLVSVAAVVSSAVAVIFLLRLVLLARGLLVRIDRKSTRLNSSHSRASRMPSSA